MKQGLQTGSGKVPDMFCCPEKYDARRASCLDQGKAAVVVRSG